MKKTYLSPECEKVKLNVGDQLLDDKFGNATGVTVEPTTPGQPGDSGGGVGGFEAKENKWPSYSVWDD